MSNDIKDLPTNRPASLTHYPMSRERRHSKGWYTIHTGRKLWRTKQSPAKSGAGAHGANSDHILDGERGTGPTPHYVGPAKAPDPMVRRAFEWICPWDYRSFKGKWGTLAEVLGSPVRTIRGWKNLSPTTGLCRMKSKDLGRMGDYIEHRLVVGMELVREIREQQRKTKIAEDRAFSSMKAGATRYQAQQGLGIGAYAKVGAEYLSGLIGGSNGKGGKG